MENVHRLQSTCSSTEACLQGASLQRKRMVIQGIVQGVGFRPFVYGQALRWHLVGFVQNDNAGVAIEVEGSGENLAHFLAAIENELPSLARIDSLIIKALQLRGETDFKIIHSQASSQERHALISPDTAVCDNCLRELFDPTDRRYRYPFINCTNCGPRFTIIQDIPYDREKTTMSVFPMCPDCQREYEDPLDRRFHAQPNACPRCGPRLSFRTWLPYRNQIEHQISREDHDSDPLTLAGQALASGAILAVKGLGGYHLACDALNEEAVKRLRQRKSREAKPFAVMVPDLATAKELCEINAEEAALLQSHSRPIVLLERKHAASVASQVAPLSDLLGILLPYTPLHFLLLQDCARIFPTNRPVALVMTSGNLSEEPIVYLDEEIEERLGGVADGVLEHNRAIHVRCDDSVIHSTPYGTQFFRRSRGYAPEPLPLSVTAPLPLLACGAHLKNTFCLVKGQQAFLSQHIGDLENLETLLSFRQGIEHLQRLFEIHPAAIAYDLHPDYLATRYALETDIPCKIGIQHHEAHIASVMAEHGLTEPVIGIAADGTGYGPDGTIWGGEIFLGDLHHFKRFAHLAPIPLPGSEQAVRQPWRMGAMYLHRAFGKDFLALDLPFVQQLDRQKWRVLEQMSDRQIQSPLTSSLGRLFDAVSALLGLRTEVVYEGQAAIELEVQARQIRQDPARPSMVYPFAIDKDNTLDVLPMIRELVHDIQSEVSIPLIAWRFHSSLAEMLTTISEKARLHSGLHKVVMSGGVFQNRTLLEMLTQRLGERGFQVYINRFVPPNDGGISLGQAAIAIARLRSCK